MTTKEKLEAMSDEELKAVTLERGKNGCFTHRANMAYEIQRKRHRAGVTGLSKSTRAIMAANKSHKI